MSENPIGTLIEAPSTPLVIDGWRYLKRVVMRPRYDEVLITDALYDGERHDQKTMARDESVTAQSIKNKKVSKDRSVELATDRTE